MGFTFYSHNSAAKHLGYGFSAKTLRQWEREGRALYARIGGRMHRRQLELIERVALGVVDEATATAQWQMFLAGQRVQALEGK